MILIDTNPLVALCDPRDGLNARALRDLERLARQPLIACQPVLTETCFQLSHPVQRERLRRFLETFSVEEPDIDDQLELRADVFAWLAKYAEHEPDWADGYLAVLSGHERRYRVWSYDAEFRTTWRRLDGSKIPLAIRI